MRIEGADDVITWELCLSLGHAWDVYLKPNHHLISHQVHWPIKYTLVLYILTVKSWVLILCKYIFNWPIRFEYSEQNNHRKSIIVVFQKVHWVGKSVCFNRNQSYPEIKNSDTINFPSKNFKSPTCYFQLSGRNFLHHVIILIFSVKEK